MNPVFPMPNSFTLGARLISLALALIVCACGGSDDAAKAPKSQPAPTALTQETTPPPNADEVVARIAGDEITRRMLAFYAANCDKPPLDPRRLYQADADELRPLLEDLAVSCRVRRDAADTLSTASLTRMAELEAAALITLLYERDVLSKIEPVSPQEIEEYYRENSEVFTSPLAFSIRHIFVSNYEEVLTQPGDTLEGLAQRIAGDPSQVQSILVDSGAKAPRAPGWNSGDRSTIKPLEPGERLLVPVSQARKQANLEKIRAAKKRIEQGEDFAAVAREVSDSMNPGQPIKWLGISGRPILPEIRKAALETDVGEVSDVFETRHGYNIMKVEHKTKQPPVPLDEARGRIRKVLQDKRINEAMDAYASRLYEMPELKIDYAAIKNPATPPEAVVVNLAGKRFRFKDLALELMGPRRPDTPNRQVMRILRVSAALQNALFEHEARRQGLHETPRYAMRRAARAWRPFADEYLKALRRRIASTEMRADEAKQYFLDHRELFNVPPSYTYYELAAGIEGDGDEAVAKATDKIASWVRDVQSIDDFRTAIARYSEDPESKAKAGRVDDRSLAALSPAARRVMTGLEPGRLSEPIHDPPYVRIFWLLEAKPARPAEYEEVAQDLGGLVRSLRLRDYPQNVVQEIVREDLEGVLER